jgi:FlaA1/EpsC-like NDP-sugar epimerase
VGRRWAALGLDVPTRADRQRRTDRLAARLRLVFPLAFLDIGIVVLTYLAALLLRFDGAVPGRYWANFRVFVPVAVPIYLITYVAFGLYGAMWRHASVQEARRILLAGATAGLAILGVGEWLGGPIRLLPLSVVVLGASLTLIGSGGVRFLGRLSAEKRRPVDAESTRVLVVGAGDAGAMVLRDIRRNSSLRLRPVGIVDENPRKIGRSLFGVPVLGMPGAIPSLVKRLDVDQVLLAIPSATSELVRDVAALCQEAQVHLRVLPSVREIMGGRVTARDIRDLKIEDLLGRHQVETDLDATAAILEGRRVLVTGGGGSIGSEIARQVAAFNPAGLALLDHDETHLHDVLSDFNGVPGVEPLLVDVRNPDRVMGAFTRFRPHVVFHAAAHKHVPLLEAHPEEAVYTNVIGTANVADASAVAGVERFVLISTDKAVKPTSVMGASKWFAEQIVRSLDSSGCVFCAVRFGNVLGSRGSVIPTFFQQISRGGPVTVTDPSMARYFMSVQEAVQLVLQAAAISSGGEVLTLDMGEPMNILDLAQKVIRLSGRVPGKDVEISFVGVRPGEKILEDIADPVERPLPSSHPSILVSRPPVPDPGALRQALRELEVLSREESGAELAARIKAVAQGSLRVPAGGGSR